MLPDEQLDLHFSESLVAAECSPPNIFDDGMQLAVTRFQRENSVASFGDRLDCVQAIHGFRQPHDATANCLRDEWRWSVNLSFYRRGKQRCR